MRVGRASRVLAPASLIPLLTAVAWNLLAGLLADALATRAQGEASDGVAQRLNGVLLA